MMAEILSTSGVSDLPDEGNTLDPSKLLSGDLVIGLIGYAGAGCTDVYKRLDFFLKAHGFETHRVKLSDGIANCSNDPSLKAELKSGEDKLVRAVRLQDLGDTLRAQYNSEAVASLALREIKQIRSVASVKRRAIIVDSLKHPAEIDLFKIVYERSFLLIGVYCGKDTRLARLQDKFFGVEDEKIENFMKRDERDPNSVFGQQVRKAFHQADFFLDNGVNAKGGHARDYDTDLRRFVAIMDGGVLVRPNADETAMYSAYSAAHRSSCLSRQVGAAITNEKGEVISTGVNEVPAFGGGVYHGGHDGEANRCFKWKWWEKVEGSTPSVHQFPCCHNTRKKNELKESIAKWMGETISVQFANAKYPIPAKDELDLDEKLRNELATELGKFFDNFDERENEGNIILDEMPGIGDLIEYSRSIHAEMDAVLAAARGGAKLLGGSIFVTTYPCHNCARHLVAAGIKEVRFLEPYDKSLAVSLHWDSIENEGQSKETMSIRPYTGIGPRVYEQYFLKKGELKDPRSGKFVSPNVDQFRIGVRLWDLDKVEDMAIEKLPPEVSIET
jgi:deoxycytidylate deaminase